MDALDLSFLEEFERQKIFAVLQRDADLHKNDQERKKKLTEKATRTQNLTIQKKIKMRSGEWFTEMKKKRQTHKKSGTDIVRQSMRRARPYSKAPNQRHRAAPTPPGKQEPMETEPHYEQSQREVQPTATPPSTPLIHKQEYTNETTIMASSTPDLYTRADTSSSDNSTRKHESRDKVDELSSAVNFLNTLDNQEGSKLQPIKQKKRSFLSSSMQSLNTLGKHKNNERFGSNWSVYSATSGHEVDVTGSIHLGFEYDFKTGTLNIKIGGCTNLAAVDEKKLSNPYVKTYLLPAKDSKRKTKTKKRTLNPKYDETLKYVISDSELSTRTLNVAVWHDKVGTNYFLGEVIIDFNEINLKKATKMAEYQLYPKGLMNSTTNAYTGDIEVALRLIPDGEDQGQLEIVLKNVNNIPSLKSDGTSSVFVKGYFLPDKSHQTKQKTPLLCGITCINFDHLFVYTGVQMSELNERCLELTVYHYEKYGSNRLIGGARIGCGSGVCFNEPASWMDSKDEEVQLWRRLMASSEDWVSGTLFLRNFQS